MKSRVNPEFNRTGILPDLYTLPDAGIVGVVHDWITPLPWRRDRVNATYLSQSLVYPTSASGTNVIQHSLDSYTHHGTTLRYVWDERLRSMEFAANLSNVAEKTVIDGDGSGPRRRFALSHPYYGRRFRYDPYPDDPIVSTGSVRSAYVTMNQNFLKTPSGFTSKLVPANQTRADAWVAASRSSGNATRFGMLRDDVFAIPVRVPKNDQGIVPSYPDSSEVPADIYDAWYVMDLIFRKSQDWRKRGSRALRALRPFVATGAHPGAMALQTLTVPPPDTRPMIELSPEQMAVSDLNKFYQRILIARKRQLNVYHGRGDFYRKPEPRGFTPGGRLYHYYSDRVGANPYERANQTRMQLALDNLIENGKGGGPPLTASNDRLLKSLSDNLKGKKGRFRQNLLGKRVDYSGRSVIVVGPTLRLHECGLPYDMGLVLYQNHLIRALVLRSRRTISYGRARIMVRERHGLALRMLRVLVESRPLLLNRAPTLHRLGFQAFQPRLVSGRAILLHPLVCGAFNADFDGDQMAVHLPLTARSRSEAWSLMWSCNHQRSVATGESLSLPSQDIVLGCYYLTSEDRLNRWKTLVRGRVANDALGVQRSAAEPRPHAQPRVWRTQPRDVHRVIWVPTGGRLELGRVQPPVELQLHASGDVASLTPETCSVGRPGVSVPAVTVKTTVGRDYAAHVTAHRSGSAFGVD